MSRPGGALEKLGGIVSFLIILGLFIAWGLFLPDRVQTRDQHGCWEITTYFALISQAERIPC